MSINSNETGQNVCDPSICNTQKFLYRDLELIRCFEDKRCKHKRSVNQMQICDCPFRNR